MNPLQSSGSGKRPSSTEQSTVLAEPQTTGAGVVDVGDGDVDVGLVDAGGEGRGWLALHWPSLFVPVSM